MENIFNPEWWLSLLIGSVIVGFLVNIASNFATPSIKVFFENTRSKQRARSKEKQQKFDNLVLKCIEQPTIFSWMLNEYHSHRTASFSASFIGIAILTVGPSINFTFSPFAMFITFILIIGAGYETAQSQYFLDIVKAVIYANCKTEEEKKNIPI